MPPITKDQREYCKVVQLSRALYEATYKKKFIKKVMSLLREIEDVNCKFLSNKSGKNRFLGGTPLHVVGFYKHVEAFAYLLGRKADFTIPNKLGDTVLHRLFMDLFHTSKKTQIKLSTISFINNELIDLVLTAHVNFGVIKNPRSSHGLSHFHIACAANHFAAVQLFLDAGQTLDESVNENALLYPGYTPLHFAIRFCSYASVKLLLEHGADVGAKNAEGLTPLHLAVTRNFTLEGFKKSASNNGDKYFYRCLDEIQKIITLLLEDNRILDVDSLGFRKAHAACTLANTLLIERILREINVNCVVNADSPTWAGYTLLHFAVHFNIDTVKLLLRKGADIGAKDVNGISPLDLCRKIYKLDDLCNVLSVASAFKDILFSDNKTRLSDFIHSMRSSSTLKSFFQTASKATFLPRNCPICPGYSLPHLIVYFSNVFSFNNTALFLSFYGNLTLSQDVHGRTPIHLARYDNKSEIVDLLLKNPSTIIDAVDHDGLSHLHIACETGNEALVQTLLSEGAKVNVIYKGKTLSSVLTNGSTPLHLAISKGNVNVIKLLIKYGANVDAADEHGITPIHHFMQPPPYFRPIGSRNIDEIGNLLFSSCDFKKDASKSGLSYLHVATQTHNENAVERLLKLGANANAVFFCADCNNNGSCSFGEYCYSGLTPLHMAIQQDEPKLIKLLLQGGADILHKESSGKTLLCDILVDKLKGYRIYNHTKACIASVLANDVSLQKRAEDEFGLTLLHVACYFSDVEQIQKLLADSRVDVNAQIHENSARWPKATPLHLFIKTSDYIENLHGTVKLFLNRGVDVTKMDVIGYTPAHLAYTRWLITSNNNDLVLLRLLLKCHKDFSINPTDKEGVSHFHLACLIGEYNMAKRFLENGVDVNLSIDSFNRYMTFQTPLLFMIETPIDVERHLRTFDLLLKHGADVNVHDDQGLTPLLKVARLLSRREDYFRKLCEAGAETKFTDLYGQSVLEKLLHSSASITNEELQCFFGYSHLFNSYNSVNGTGIISLMICETYPFREDRQFILDAIIEMPNLLMVDSLGRTPIHNIVASLEKRDSTSETYAYYIERFIKMGYDVDAQDLEDKTALHLAAYFNNEKTLSVLLSCGANINLTDNRKRTPTSVLLEYPLQDRYGTSENSNERVKHVIVLHTISMLLCGLEINSNDLELIETNVFEDRFNLHREQVLKELEMTKTVNVGTSSLTLRDFLSETGAVASRPSMASGIDRQASDKLLESIDFKPFSKLRGLINLQHRKMMIRLVLIPTATDYIRRLLGNVNGFSVPELCCRMILRFLSNFQIKNLIKAVSLDETGYK